MSKISIHELKEITPGVYRGVIGKNKATVKFKDIGEVYPALKGEYAVSKSGLLLSIKRRATSASMYKYNIKSSVLVASARKDKNFVNIYNSKIYHKEAGKKLWG